MSTTDHHFGAYPKEEPLGTYPEEEQFGACPVCHSHDGFYNAGRNHWFVCHEHRVRWWVGSNLFSAWREETENEQRHAYEVEPGWGFYEDVDPLPPMILSELLGDAPGSYEGVDEGPC
jgi:hypothetical protein